MALAISPTLAPWNIAPRRWYAEQFDELAAVAVAVPEWTEVLLEVSPVISQGDAGLRSDLRPMGRTS